jgi:predicted nuclease of restriction endonuclease-like (RecB) superfamily
VLEEGLIKNIRKFPSEIGDDFSFIGNQHHLKDLPAATWLYMSQMIMYFL